MGEAIDRAIDHLLLRAGVTREQIETARRKAAGDRDLGAHLEEIAAAAHTR